MSDPELELPVPDAPDEELLDGVASRTSAGFGELLSFLRPFLPPVRGAVSGSLLFGTLALLAGATVPLVVEGALSHGLHRGTIALLAGLMLADLVLYWVAQRLSYRAAARLAEDLTASVYERLLESPMLRQVGLRRPSVISRHTSDIDRIEEAVDVTLDEGYPGVARILLSLVLLCYVEYRAGIIMLVATGAFMLVYLRIGRGLLQVDRERLDTSSDVGATAGPTSANRG